MNQLGIVLKEKRKRKGWSQTILGDLVGMSAATIHRIEHGEKIPIDDELSLFADILGLEVAELVQFASEDRQAVRNSIVPATSYHTQWEYAHPADYAGRVWIQIYPKSGLNAEPIKIQIQWGAWQYQASHLIEEHKSIILSHYKFNDGQGLPLIIQLSQPCYVVFGKDAPPDKVFIDIINQWQRIEPMGFLQMIRLIGNYLSIYIKWHIQHIGKEKQ